MTATIERLWARRPVSTAIKRFLPKSLFGRSLLIIVSPLILLQVFSAYVFFERHWETVAVRLSRALAGDIAATIDLMRQAPTAEDRANAFAFARQHFQIEVEFREGAIFKNEPEPDSDRVERLLRHELSQVIHRPIHIDNDALERDVIVDIQLSDGVLHILAPRKRLFTSTTYLFIALMVGSSLILFAVAMMFMRNQVRPIRRLAAAADSLGKGQDVPSFRIQGATEVRQAAAAFNLMRNRLQRQMSQRTEMLAGVSHDLRTPLTRMKLQLAMMPDIPGGDELRADVEEMARMVEGYLAFARGEGDEAARETDLAELIEDVAATMRRQGADVEIASESRLVATVRREALRRCLANLAGNAVRHGSKVTLGARHAGTAIELTVDDDGPGIPPSERETVFRPFHRLDASRNVETGGVGLGLTIARDVVHGHGGEIFLEESPMGGLRARIRLPM